NASCAMPVPMPENAEEARAVPRQTALELMQDLLKGSVGVISTLPWARILGKDVREWSVGDEGIEVQSARKSALRVLYREMKDVQILQIEEYYYVIVSIEKLEREGQFRFIWEKPEDAQTFAALLEGVRTSR